MKKTSDNGMETYNRYYRWQNQYYKTGKPPENSQLLSAFLKAISGKITATLCIKGFRPMYEKGNTGFNNHFYLGNLGPIPVSVVCSLAGRDPAGIQLLYSLGLTNIGSKEPDKNLRQEITDLLPFPRLTWYRDEGKIENSREIGTTLKGTVIKSLILSELQSMGLEELGDVFQLLSDKVCAHREENKGFVPLPIFPFCVGIGGIYPCVEIVIRTPNGFALKKRSKKEQGWEGKYQIVGATLRTTDKPENVYDRVLTEIFGENKQSLNLWQSQKLEFVGTEIHDEPERQATCLTLVWQIRMMEKDLAGLDGEWKFFKNPRDKRIVNHHQKTLAWATDPSHGLFVDLR